MTMDSWATPQNLPVSLLSSVWRNASSPIVIETCRTGFFLPSRYQRVELSIPQGYASIIQEILRASRCVSKRRDLCDYPKLDDNANYSSENPEKSTPESPYEIRVFNADIGPSETDDVSNERQGSWTVRAKPVTV